MALDGIYIHSIVNELRNSLLNGKVTKINQPEQDEVFISIRTENLKNVKLLISTNSSYPKIHLTKTTKVNPLNPPLFCMVLRKYLGGSKIIDLRQFENDRIIEIDFLSSDEMGYNSEYTLIVEIMGRHSNLTLTRKRDNIIMDSIKHLSLDMNRHRTLMPSLKYIYPPSDNKINPFDFDILEITDIHKIPFDENFFFSIFSGVSKELSRELFFRYITLKNNSNTSSEDGIKFFCDFIENIKRGEYDFSSYSNDKNLVSFHCVELTHLEGLKKHSYTDGSTLLEEYFILRDKQERLNAKASTLKKLITTNMERCLKKEVILDKTLEKAKSKEKFRLYGELLTANIYSIKEKKPSITVTNYYSENAEKITIPLNMQKSPSDNIQIYYKKYNKLKVSDEMASIQKKENAKELEYLLSVLNNLSHAETYQEIEEIRNELVSEGYIKFSKTKGLKNKKELKLTKYISSDDYEIYLGKNNIQNDYLTLKFAKKNDLWFHTKNIPGSHVVIKRKGNDEIPDRTILEAANIAGYFSKGKESSNVPVDYTEIRNVKKPSGAKAGMVIYYTNKTIYITPEEIKLNQV